MRVLPVEFPPAFDVTVDSDGDCAVLAIVGELDFAVAERVRAAVERVDDARILFIDLRRLTFMDSAGIHLLFAARERRLASGGELRVVRGPAIVHRGLAALELEDELEFVDEPPVAA